MQCLINTTENKTSIPRIFQSQSPFTERGYTCLIDSSVFTAVCLSQCTSRVETFSTIQLFRENYTLRRPAWAFHAICSDISREREIGADGNNGEFTTTAQYRAINKFTNISFAQVKTYAMSQ